MVAWTDAKIAAGQKASWKASKVGGTHTGNIDLLPESVISVDSSGNLVWGTIVVAMNTIAVTDITDTGMNAKLVEHLKWADFFDVANYPTTKVVTTAVANNTITADITIRGVTKSITVPVTLTLDGDMYLLSTTLEIVRKDFGIADTLLGKVALEDNFTITLDKVAFTR